MTINTTTIVCSLAAAFIAYKMGMVAGAKPAPTTTSTGSTAPGNAAGPEWWSYAGSWR